MVVPVDALMRSLVGWGLTVDKNLIFVVGHSQSAQFIPHLMKANKGIRAGVMLAAPYQPVDKVLAGQLQSTQDLLTRLKIKKEFADSATKDLESWVNDLRRLREGRFQGTPGRHAGERAGRRRPFSALCIAGNPPPVRRCPSRKNRSPLGSG